MNEKFGQRTDARWERQVLFHTTAVGTYRISRRPGITEEAFMNRMTEEVLPAALIPGLNRVTNVIAQELSRDETEGEANTYLWAIFWNGVHAPDRVRDGCEAMYDSVREKLELVGTRTSLTIATIEGRWQAEP